MVIDAVSVIYDAYFIMAKPKMVAPEDSIRTCSLRHPDGLTCVSTFIIDGIVNNIRNLFLDGSDDLRSFVGYRVSVVIQRFLTVEDVHDVN